MGIGRTLAYQLVDAWRAGAPHGLPAWMIGSCLRVPRWAIDEMVRYGRVISDVCAEATAIIDARANASSSTRSRHGSHARWHGCRCSTGPERSPTMFQCLSLLD